MTQRSVEQLGSPVESEVPGTNLARKFPNKTGTLGLRSGRGGTWVVYQEFLPDRKPKAKLCRLIMQQNVSIL